MNTEAIRMKCRKAEEHAALMVRSCKSAIAYCFEKVIKVVSLMYIFVHRAKKTESKFMDADKICKISYSQVRQK